MKLNRRQFFVGSGAMLATGCAPCHSVCEARDKEWSLDNRLRLRMKCPGIVEPVKVWVAGDTHLALHDGRDDAYAANYKRMTQWPGDTVAFEKMLAEAKAAGIDLLVLVGDIISFPGLPSKVWVARSAPS